METILFKKKNYEILSKLDENTFKVSFKGKTFALKVFNPDSLELSTFIRQTKRLKIAGVRMPKVIKIDKKECKALIEFIEGENILNILAKQDLDEKYLKAIFELAWFAEAEKITLDYHPDNFVFTNKGELVYVKYDYVDGVDDKKNFKTTYVKYWFFTKDFVNYAKSKGIDVDMKRLKDEYIINKEICLAVVKYYI